jgi:hypothetical protein
MPPATFMEPALGGANGHGTLFKLTHPGGGWTKTILPSFAGASDGIPSGDERGTAWARTLSGSRA